VARGTAVKWPVGLGGKGNEGVAGQIKNTPGALRLRRAGVRHHNKLPVASVRTRRASSFRTHDREYDGGGGERGQEHAADSAYRSECAGGRRLSDRQLHLLLVYREQGRRSHGRSS